MADNSDKINIIKDISEIPTGTGSIYPAEFSQGLEGRLKQKLTEALGLTQFGVNIVTLKPHSITSQRHWHKNEDEFVYILEGEVVLETNAGETVLTAGMAVGFPANNADGHRVINKSDKPAVLLEVGTRCENEDAEYPDIDMVAKKRNGVFSFYRKDGTPIE